MPASRTEKTLYWLSPSLVLLLMSWSIVLYHIRHEVMSGFFTELGYPSYIVYPLAYLKLAAVIVIISNRYNDLKDMAYAAYFINQILATAGHLSVGHEPYHAYVGLIALPISYIYSNKVRGRPKRNLLDLWSRDA